MSAKDTTLSDQLPEARIQEVIAAVGHSWKTGVGEAKLAGFNPDGGNLGAALDSAVRSALTISPLAALLKAWKGLEAVAKLTGPEGPEDGKERIVAIAGHTLSAKHTPVVHIELGQAVDLKKIPIHVTYSLKVEGLLVHVTNRKITAIGAGQATPSVVVKVENVKVVEEKLPVLDLGMDLALEAGAEPEPA